MRVSRCAPLLYTVYYTIHYMYIFCIFCIVYIVYYTIQPHCYTVFLLLSRVFGLESKLWTVQQVRVSPFFTIQTNCYGCCFALLSHYYIVKLLSCYIVVVLHCCLVTLLSCYIVVLLHCCLVTLLLSNATCAPQLSYI